MEERTDYICPSCNIVNSFDKNHLLNSIGMEEINAEEVDIPEPGNTPEKLIIEGDVARCSICGHITEKDKKGNYDSFWKKCSQNFLITGEQSKVDEKILSNKYSILELYKGLAFYLCLSALDFLYIH